MTWDLDRIRKNAGVVATPAQPQQLTEGWSDDDDDEHDDPDVRVAMSDPKQKEFESRNKKSLDADQKMMKDRALSQKEKALAREKQKDDEKEKQSSPTPAADSKDDAGKGEPETEAKRRGKAPDENSKSGQARSWLVNNPNAKRGEFIAHASSFEMSKHHANTFFYAHKKVKKTGGTATECFVLIHPHAQSLTLAENIELKTYQWIDASSDIEPSIFFEREQAEAAAKYMAEWRNQTCIISTIAL